MARLDTLKAINSPELGFPTGSPITNVLSDMSGIFNSIDDKTAPEDLSQRLSDPSSKAGATIYIVDSIDKSEVKAITNKFFLTGFSLSRQEKAQLIETFGASSISFFDDSIKIYNLIGSAVDYPTERNPYRGMQQSSLIQLYDTELRGTQLVKKGNIAIMRVMNHTIFGYPLNLRVQYSASADKIASFYMSWVVTKHKLSTLDITEQDLKRNYIPGVSANDSPEKTAIRENINSFFAAYKKNLIINFDSNDRTQTDSVTKFVVTDYIVAFMGKSPTRLNDALLLKAGTTEVLEELKSEIQGNIKSMVSYLQSANLGAFISLLSDRQLSDIDNQVDNMFTNADALYAVGSFLETIKAIHAKLFMTKLFL